MIYKELSFYEFEKEFEGYSRDGQFPKGLKVLYDYLREISDETGEPIELDVIALCCEFNETSVKDALEEYQVDSLEEIEDTHFVLYVDDETIIIGR